MATIAFLGLGAMGARMAARLMEAGHALRVYNRTPARADALAASGAMRCATPAEAADGAEVVIAMVRDVDASRRVWTDPVDGALRAIRAGALAIEMSTLTPEWMRELADEARAAGARLVEAPVVGSRPQAEAGALVILAGGTDADIAAARPVLEQMGASVRATGEVGSAAVMKLAVNALFGVQVAAVAEALAFAARHGFAPADALEILAGAPVLSPAAQNAASAMVARAFAPLFPIELVEKDFDYVVVAAKARGLEPAVIEAARRVYAAAREDGHGGDNITGVAQLYD